MSREWQSEKGRGKGSRRLSEQEEEKPAKTKESEVGSHVEIMWTQNPVEEMALSTWEWSTVPDGAGRASKVRAGMRTLGLVIRRV